MTTIHFTSGKQITVKETVGDIYNYINDHRECVLTKVDRYWYELSKGGYETEETVTVNFRAVEYFSHGDSIKEEIE